MQFDSKNATLAVEILRSPFALLDWPPKAEDLPPDCRQALLDWLGAVDKPQESNVS